MSARVRIVTEAAVAWPARCASCGVTEGLGWARASSGRVTSMRPTLTGALNVGTEWLTMAYPVCDRHAKGLTLANLVTRNTFGIRLLRGFVYLIGPLALLTLPTVLVASLFGRPGVAPPLEMMSLFLLAAASFILILRSFRTLPLRIIRQTDDAVEVRFRDRGYAAAFLKANAGTSELI